MMYRLAGVPRARRRRWPNAAKKARPAGKVQTGRGGKDGSYALSPE